MHNLHQKLLTDCFYNLFSAINLHLRGCCQLILLPNWVLVSGSGGCRKVSKPNCVLKPREVCQPIQQNMCTQIPSQQCQQVPKENCVPVEREVCETVQQQLCNNVPRQQCSDVPRQECIMVPREECFVFIGKISWREGLSGFMFIGGS